MGRCAVKSHWVAVDKSVWVALKETKATVALTTVIGDSRSASQGGRSVAEQSRRPSRRAAGVTTILTYCTHDGVNDGSHVVTIHGHTP